LLVLSSILGNKKTTFSFIMLDVSSEMFARWITDELNTRSWSLRELGRQANLSNTTISQVLSGQANPGLDFCKGVAGAFGMRAEEVLARAGLIPAPPKETATSRELLAMFAQLGDDDQERVLEIVRALRDAERRRNEQRATTA
jgi:transcriptional regulator with XRE-family HTH domain